MNPGCKAVQRPVYSNQQEKERALYANRIYCLLCKDYRIRPCSWDDSPAWADYVDGRIDERELLVRAEAEIHNFQGEFAEVRMMSEYETKGPSLVRTKLAGRIYSKLCSGSGLSLCFFKNFATWSDFVHDRLNEDEFIEKAKMELQTIKEEHQNRSR